MKIFLTTFIIFIFAYSTSSLAYLRRPRWQGVRALGMGNCLLASPNDSNSLWYNPAGLGLIKGSHLNLINLTLGAESMDTFNRFVDAINGTTTNLLTLDTQFFTATLNPSFLTKFFGFGLYESLTGFFDVRGIFNSAGQVDILNLPQASIDIYQSNDLGAIVGVGFPLSEFFSVGASARVMFRTSIDASKTLFNIVSDLSQTIPTSQEEIKQILVDYLGTVYGAGFGVGINAGALARIPIPGNGPLLQLGATIEDIGDTKFTAVGPSAPRTQTMSYNAGASLLYNLSKTSSLNILLEGHDLLSAHSYWMTYQAGLEFKIRGISLRTGIFEGYPTFGLSYETLPHTSIHLASYAHELGTKLWQRNMRVYLVQVTIGFWPK